MTIKPSQDGETIEVIWNRHGDQLRRRARTRLRQYGLVGQAESMDICNDVMADLVRRRPENASADQLLGYIFRAIDHQVIDTFRTLARQCRDFRRNEPIDQHDDPGRSAAATPSVLAVRREVLDRVRIVLGQHDAAAIDGMLENRDWNEIGRELKIAPDTIRMRVRRAIEKVRGEFDTARRCHDQDGG